MVAYLSLVQPPPNSTLFPYTTLFRSLGMVAELEAVPFRFRTLEGTAITKSKRQTPQNPTNLRPAKQRQLRAVHAACPHTQRSEEHTSELQSPCNLVCRLLLETKNIMQ